MGGMAVVYEAEDAILGRRVAVKMLHRRFAEDASFRLRFKQEARVMASLDHENIVKVYDICHSGEGPFIVAEYIDGRDVGDMLREAPDGCLDEPSTRRISAQLLRALDYAHRRGVVHRDIKPSNILLTEEGTAKVADFGIARVVEDEEAEAGARPGEVIGSARYMSPEQLKGERTTPRSDLYSAGVLLYHCLTGRPPFSGTAKSVARQQIGDEPTPPRKLNRAITPHMQAVILKALQKRPEERYTSAAEMLQDLQRDALAFDPAEASGASRLQRKRKRLRKSRGPLLAPAALALLLLLGGGAAAATLSGYVDLSGGSSFSGSADEAPASAPASPDPVVVAEAPPKAPEPPGVSPASGALLQGEPEASSAEGEEEAEEAETTLSEDAEPENLSAVGSVPVPNVDTLFDYFAEQTLRDSGFKPQVVYGYREGYAPKGVVWNTDPASGTLMPSGSTVTVYATPKDQPQTQAPAQPPAGAAPPPAPVPAPAPPPPAPAAPPALAPPPPAPAPLPAPVPQAAPPAPVPPAPVPPAPAPAPPPAL